MLLQELIDEYILLFRRGELTSSQQRELIDWLNADATHQAYYRKMLKLYACIEMTEEDLVKQMQDSVHNRLYKQIYLQRFKRKVWWQTGAAAVVIAMIGSILIMEYSRTEPTTLTPTFGEAGSSKAILTLANGEKISLTEQTHRYITTSEGNLIQQDSIGHLHIYAIDSNHQKQTVCQNNVIWVPQGGEYHLILSDGTKVWLNAETKLKFPARFSGDKRIVELSGEAYLEVTSNASKPFIIRTDGIDVKVLGTSFGVRSYQEETSIFTTLVSGSVEVQGTHGKVRLTPSHQAVYDKNSKDIAIKQVNTELYTGWKNGKMLYDNCPLEEILRDLKRWYSFEVFYTNSQSKQIPFTLNIRKYEKIDGVLELMQKTGRVHFDIKGDTIIVK